MSDAKPTTRHRPIRRWLAEALSWLGGHPPRAGRSRHRWTSLTLTIVLIVTAVGAWAAAIIQPWSLGEVRAGFVPRLGIDAGRAREIAHDAEHWAIDTSRRPVRPLARDVFQPADEPRAGNGAAAEDDDRDTPGPTADDLVETVKKLDVTALVTDAEGRRTVIINGHDYRLGDTVAGLRIVQIEEGWIRLRKAGATCRLRMD